jgi:hypothetical protein
MTPIDLRPPVCPHATAATGGNRRSRLSGEVSKAVFPIGFELSSRQNCPIPDGCGSFVVGEEPDKRKCGQCPHFSLRIGSYSGRFGPDCLCFLEFPVFAGAGMRFESHLGHSVSAGQSPIGPVFVRVSAGASGS